MVRPSYLHLWSFAPLIECIFYVYCLKLVGHACALVLCITDMGMRSAEQAIDATGPLPEAMELHTGAGAGQWQHESQHTSAMHEAVWVHTWDLVEGICADPVQITGGHKYLPPRQDVNAPDLYIPFMAVCTCCLLASISKVLTGRFSPDTMYATVSSP